jgi:membrane protein
MKSAQESSSSSLARMQTLYQRSRRFVLRDIWLIDPATFPSGKGFLVRQLQVVVIVARGFFQDQCLLRASALTYTTMLSLVPMLAFMFAFLKGLGVQNLLEPLLLNRLSIGSEQTVRLIIDFVNNIKIGTLGAIGLGSLLLTTLLQLGTVEHSLNEIWGVREGRTLLRKITDYISVMVIAPVALFLAIAVTAALRNQTLVTFLLEKRIIGDAVVLIFTLLPYAAVWLALTFVYIFIPNTRVRFVPALIGGIVAGTLWQFAQWVYIEFQVGMTKYNAIYGAFAQLPVLMFWLYVSWAIVLLGAEMTFAFQNASTYAFERVTPFTSFQVKEQLALTFYFELVRAFAQDTGPWSALAFARQHRIPIRLMRELLSTMAEEKLIIEAAGKPEHYVPGRDPSTITPWHILHALRHHGDPTMQDLIEWHDSRVTTLLHQVQEAEHQVAGSRNVMQWLTEKAPASEAEPLDVAQT